MWLGSSNCRVRCWGPSAEADVEALRTAISTSSRQARRYVGCFCNRSGSGVSKSHGIGGCHDWWLCTSLLFHVVDPAVVWIELQLYLRHAL